MAKNMLKNSLGVLGGLAASIAFVLTAVNANAACLYIVHQPEMPEAARKLRKF